MTHKPNKTRIRQAMEERIKANAAMTIEQLRPLSDIDFGYNPESVEWLQKYIENLRQAGQMDELLKQKLTDVLGSFLGECIIHCYGGTWIERDGVWNVALDADHLVCPFAKVAKQMDNGLTDGVVPFFRTIPALLAGDASHRLRPLNVAETPLNAVEYLQYMASLFDESVADSETSIVKVMDQIFRLAILERADEVHFIVRPDDSLDIRLHHGQGWTTLPPLTSRGSAISRLLVLGNLEKGELARSKPQTASAVISNIPMVFETEPIGLWRENIRVRISYPGRET